MKTNFITVVVIDNPLKKGHKKIKKIKLPITQKDVCLEFVIRNMPKSYSVIIGGKIIPKSLYKKTRVKSGSIIAITQSIKGGQDLASTLVMTAALAASVLLPGIGNIVAGAIMFVGGAIISQFDPPETEDEESQDNYSWSAPKINVTQGAPIAVTYGRVCVNTPQLLAGTRTYNSPYMYLNCILSGGEGELDSIEHILINNKDIDAYTDCTYETRLGTNDQSGVSISTLGESMNSQVFTHELSTTTSYYTEATTNNQVHGLEFIFFAASGLYAVKNSLTGGNPLSAEELSWPVWAAEDTKFSLRNRISIEYRPYGSSGAWTVHEETISGSNDTPVFVTFRYNGLTPGRYEIRVKNIATEVLCVYKTYVDVYHRSAATDHSVWLDQDHAIVTGRFKVPLVKQTEWQGTNSFFDVIPVRPCLSLVAMRVKATDQISGSAPSITWTQTRGTVWVWDPVALEYTAQDASNPWWAAYDLIHNCRKIKNLKTDAYEFIVYGAPKEALLYDEFKTCADYADSINLKFNYIFNEPLTLADALKIAVTNGRGAIVIKGSQYGATCDRPRTPSQMFNMGNIKKDSFKETFLSTTGRANMIEISFMQEIDPGTWEKATMPVYDVDFDDSGVVQNPTRLDMPSITDPERAYREGKYFLRRNRLIKRVIEFVAGIDSISVDIGDVISVQHDLPKWGQGGRVQSYLGSNTILLDKPFTFETGIVYKIVIRHAENDARVIYGVSPAGPENTTDTVLLDTVLERAIVPRDDLYSIGEENIMTKPFEITAITNNAEHERTISAMEYSDAVYVETGTVPEIVYSTARTIVEVENLSGFLVSSTGSTGLTTLTLMANWSLPVTQGENIIGFTYSYSMDDGITWTSAVEIQNTNFSIVVTQDISYIVRVKTKNNLGQTSAGVDVGPLTSTSQTFPPNPTGIVAAPQTVEVAGNQIDGWRFAVFTNALPPTFNGFMYRYVLGSTADWDAGAALNTTGILNNTYDTVLLPAGETVTVMVKTSSTTGTLSLGEAHVTFDVPEISPVNVLSTFDCHPTWAGTKEDCTVDGGVLKANLDAYVPGYYGEAVYGFDLNMGFDGYISLNFDIVGPYAVRYSKVPGTWITYTGPFLVTASETISYLITMEISATQGMINTFTLTQWSPARIDDTGWHIISSSGETIPPTTPFNNIQAVETNIQNTATETATQVQVTDIDPVTGAHFHGYNPAGAAAALNVNIRYLGN